MNFKISYDFQEFKNLFIKFKSIKDAKNIDISKIYTNRNDSIFYFDNKILTKDSREFYKFDVLMNYSRVIFNKNYNKAIIVASASISKLAGSTVLFFLIKTKNGRWIIKYDKSLSIS
ncbi:MAG: hypothetical protein ACWIPI_10580 [Polaribacter sp.]